MLKTISFAHYLLKEIIVPGDTVIDATCGNGNDTLMLAEACGENGHVYAFDIQKQAVQTTKALMENEHIHHVTCIEDSHANIDQYIPEKKEGSIAAAVFNLGYLPRSDKTIITTPDSTIAALNKLLVYLRKGGRIVLVVYYGHEGGEHEKNEVLSFVSQLDQSKYEVMEYRFLNQKNNPPFVVGIEKRSLL